MECHPNPIDELFIFFKMGTLHHQAVKIPSFIRDCPIFPHLMLDLNHQPDLKFSPLEWPFEDPHGWIPLEDAPRMPWNVSCSALRCIPACQEHGATQKSRTFMVFIQMKWDLRGIFNSVYISGCWFGTFVFFPYTVLGIVIPTDELILFRGVETTNQCFKYGCYGPKVDRTWVFKDLPMFGTFVVEISIVHPLEDDSVAKICQNQNLSTRLPSQRQR